MLEMKLLWLTQGPLRLGGEANAQLNSTSDPHICGTHKPNGTENTHKHAPIYTRAQTDKHAHICADGKHTVFFIEVKELKCTYFLVKLTFTELSIQYVIPADDFGRSNPLMCLHMVLVDESVTKKKENGSHLHFSPVANGMWECVCLSVRVLGCQWYVGLCMFGSTGVCFFLLLHSDHL